MFRLKSATISTVHCLRIVLKIFGNWLVNVACLNKINFRKYSSWLNLGVSFQFLQDIAFNLVYSLIPLSILLSKLVVYSAVFGRKGHGRPEKSRIFLHLPIHLLDSEFTNIFMLLYFMVSFWKKGIIKNILFKSIPPVVCCMNSKTTLFLV